MPKIVSPTSLPSSSKLLAVIAPPSITVWLPSAPTKVAPPAVKLVLKPSAAVISILSTPKLVPKPSVFLMLMPVASKLVAPSIVVVPVPGSAALSGLRSMPPTLSGSFAPFNSSAYTSKSLIALPTSLSPKLPNFRLPLTSVLPVALSTVNLPLPIFKLPSSRVSPVTVKPSLSTALPPVTDKPPLVTANLPSTVAPPVTDKPF